MLCTSIEDSEHTPRLQRHADHNAWADDLVDELAHLYATPEELRSIDMSRCRRSAPEGNAQVLPAVRSSTQEDMRTMRGPNRASKLSTMEDGRVDASVGQQGSGVLVSRTQAHTHRHSAASTHPQPGNRDAQIDDQRLRLSTGRIKSPYNASVHELFRDLVGKISKLESLAPTRLQDSTLGPLTHMKWREGSLSSLGTDGAADIPIPELLRHKRTQNGTNVAATTSLPGVITQLAPKLQHGMKEMRTSDATPAMQQDAQERIVPPEPPPGLPTRPRLDGKQSSMIPGALASSHLMPSGQSTQQPRVQFKRPVYHPRVLATERPGVWRRSAEKKRNKMMLPEDAHGDHMFSSLRPDSGNEACERAWTMHLRCDESIVGGTSAANPLDTIAFSDPLELPKAASSAPECVPSQEPIRNEGTFAIDALQRTHVDSLAVSPSSLSIDQGQTTPMRSNGDGRTSASTLPAQRAGSAWQLDSHEPSDHTEVPLAAALPMDSDNDIDASRWWLSPAPNAQEDRECAVEASPQVAEGMLGSMLAPELLNATPQVPGKGLSRMREHSREGLSLGHESRWARDLHFGEHLAVASTQARSSVLDPIVPTGQHGGGSAPLETSAGAAATTTQKPTHCVMFDMEIDAELDSLREAQIMRLRSEISQRLNVHIEKVRGTTDGIACRVAACKSLLLGADSNRLCCATPKRM
jgi:hypothetical protein